MAMSFIRILVASLMLALTGIAGPAAAVDSGWVENAESKARLVSATTAAGELGELRFGLEIALSPEWKTYWRSPGEGGLPPELDWSGSENVAFAEIGWPAPKRFQILGIDSVGYEQHVIYPITVVPARPGEPVEARVAVNYLTCKDICVPQRAELSLSLPGGPATPSEHAFAIDQARGQVPGPGVPGFELASARISESGGGQWFLELETASPLNEPDAFIETADRAFAFGRPERLGPGKLRLPILYAAPEPAALEGRDVTVTLTDGSRAFEENTAVAAPIVTSQDWVTWVTILATAFLGGLILNLMPCVLPVLSIKLMGVMKHGGGETAKARASFLGTAAGIVFSFAALAAGAIALKASGVAVGWGIQFQEPVFIAFMVLVCMLFAANLWGLFEIPLPAFAGKLGTGHGGSFATGMFATLLATPCSAPFVGTAVAFALAGGWQETVAVFAAMGLGLALPYLAVAARPQLATRLPRPGRWMIGLRAILGLALAATAVWLLSVLLSLSGEVITLALAVLSVALLLWLWLAQKGWRMPGAVVAIAIGLALPAVLPLLVPGTAPSQAETAADRLWQPFSQDRLATLVANGQTVLVDVTADWCITCKANKAAVLDRAAMRERLASDVVGLRADWTRPDPAIQAYLASFGRYGIPFNAVYGPNAANGIPLSELLTESEVLAALKRASR